MAKKVTGQIKLQIPAGQANPGPAGRPGPGPARRQHHGVLQGIQRRHQGTGRHDHSGGHHGFCGQILYFHHQVAAGVGPAQEGRRHRFRLEGAEQGQGRQGHAQAGAGHCQTEDEGFERHHRRGGVPGDCGHGPQHGDRSVRNNQPRESLRFGGIRLHRL